MVGRALHLQNFSLLPWPFLILFLSLTPRHGTPALSLFVCVCVSVFVCVSMTIYACSLEVWWGIKHSSWTSGAWGQVVSYFALLGMSGVAWLVIAVTVISGCAGPQAINSCKVSIHEHCLLLSNTRCLQLNYDHSCPTHCFFLPVTMTRSFNPGETRIMSRVFINLKNCKHFCASRK